LAPGKGPGNWEGKLGVGDDGSVTGVGAKACKPGFRAVLQVQMS